MRFKKGLVLVYTGNGKGKTTAAIGLALRAIGHGNRVFMVQFMKAPGSYGEIIAVERYLPDFKIIRVGRTEFVGRPPTEEDVSNAQEGLRIAEEAVQSGIWNMVIMDEINVAVDYGLVKVGEVVRIIAERPPNVVLVLTGRNAHADIEYVADMVTEMKEVKHHFRNGVSAQPGIEF